MGREGEAHSTAAASPNSTFTDPLRLAPCTHTIVPPHAGPLSVEMSIRWGKAPVV